MKGIFQAMQATHRERNYILLACLVFLVALGLNYYSLVYAVPGSSLALFVKGSTWWQIPLPLLFSALIAILISMQVFMLRKRCPSTATTKIGTGALSSFSGIIGSIFGSAGCLSCLTAVFGFLSTGTLLFLVKYRYTLISASMLLLLFSIHLTAKSINRNSCAMPSKQRK